MSLSSDGSFVYTPATGFIGTDTFTYHDEVDANGQTLRSAPATVTVTVGDRTIVTATDSYHVDANAVLSVPAGSLAANDTNPDNVPLGYTVYAYPSHGTLMLNADGSFTYTPSPGYNGLDHFSYNVWDHNEPANTSNTSNVVLSVGTGNYVPPIVPGSPSTAPPANVETFSNSLQGLWNYYIAAKDRLGQVAAALADLGNSAQYIRSQDATTDEGTAAINDAADTAVAKLDALYLAYDAYTAQAQAATTAAGNYMKTVWYTSSADAAAIAAIGSLPVEVAGLNPDREQLAKYQAAFANFAAGADFMLANNTFTVTAAQDTHDALDRTIQYVGAATLVGGLAVSGAEILTEQGCAAFLKATTAKLVNLAAAQATSIIAVQNVAYLAKMFGVSEDQMRIGADAVQLFFLYKAARAERQAMAAQGSNCFVAGTEVETDSNGVLGQEPIEDVHVGDEVLSRDQNNPSGAAEARQVTAVFSRTAYVLADVTIRDAAGTVETIRVTPEHPFYVDGVGWTASDQLAAGEQLSEDDGAEATVIGVANEACPTGVTVYNFTVDGDHTYFVAQGGQAVWVHNSCAQPEFPNVEDEAGYVNSNPAATLNEQNVGKLLNNTAATGQLGEVATVEGNVDSPPGSSRKPDYKVTYRDGSTGFADLYEPDSPKLDADNIASNAMDKGKQTAGGIVFVRVPVGMDAGNLESAIRVQAETPGAVTAGTSFYMIETNGSLKPILVNYQ